MKKRRWIYAMSVLLLMSFAFAWTAGYSPPACINSYTVLGYNFTLTTEGEALTCSANTSQYYGLTMLNGTGSYSTHIGVTWANMSLGTADDVNISVILTDIPTTARNMFISQYSRGQAGGGSGQGTGLVTLEVFVDGAWVVINKATTSVNPATCLGVDTGVVGETTQINLTSTEIRFVQTNISADCNNTPAYYRNTLAYALPTTLYFRLNQTLNNPTNTEVLISELAFNFTSSTKEGSGVYGSIPAAPSLYYSKNGNYLLRSDVFNSKANASSTNYCRQLLYFNNPYYGNIQLIPKITYTPGVEAVPYFYNSTDQTAFIRNNSISYIYDSITSTWYIVPATVCNNYSVIGSINTLQYNPTSTGTNEGGTIPIDINQLSGACSYNNNTRLITCNGSDASGTLTSLSLSAYRIGNTTDVCAQTAAGSSGTLTCTLPNVNGTYNAYFYGTDANLFQHQLSYRQMSVWASAATGYGRDAFIMALIIFCVGASLFTGNIAVMMVIGVIGLFFALAAGILPASTAPVIVFFALIALVLAYKLKV